MSDLETDFPQLSNAIADGIQRKLHTCVQIYVSIDAATLLNASAGFAAPGMPLSIDSQMLWRSAGKPLTAALIVKRIEQHRLSLQNTVGQFLPECPEGAIANLTVHQLLTHTSAIPTIETGWPADDWNTAIDRILHSQLQVPPGTAAYHPQSSWFLLGEILRRTSLTPHHSFAALLNDELLTPLECHRTSCGLADGIKYTDPSIPTLYERDRGELVESAYNDQPHRTQPSAGGGLRGPVRELGRFYEMLLLNGQQSAGNQFLNVESVADMTKRHRIGEYDQTLQHIVDFGLGLIINSNRYGTETVPYGFGRYAANDAFGHGGSQCAMGFCDPVKRLVVAWAANGFCGEGQHQRRNRAINEAIYRDLGFDSM